MEKEKHESTIAAHILEKVEAIERSRPALKRCIAAGICPKCGETLHTKYEGHPYLCAIYCEHCGYKGTKEV